MKQTVEEIEIKSSGKMQSEQFGMQFDAHMADMLSSKIYTKPVLAVCREYIANAIDAQKITKSTQPIDIHLPTTMAPHWSVRDYGPGLTQAEVMGDENGPGLFNTYGRSDKTKSNKLIGGFGLGSKAGFAYVDKGSMFTVTSWCDGWKKVYTCHRNIGGMPSITLMSATESIEPTGVEIKVPVKYSDYDAFKQETIGLLKYFDGTFKVVPSSVTWEKVDYIAKTATWGIRKASDGELFSNRDRVNVVMGGIAYKANDALSYGQNAQHLDLFFPIGSIPLAVSRESIQADDEAKKKISAAYEVFQKEYRQRVLDTIAAAPSWEDACKQVSGLHRIRGVKWDNLNPMWQGKPVYAGFNVTKKSPYYQADMFTKPVFTLNDCTRIYTLFNGPGVYEKRIFENNSDTIQASTNLKNFLLCHYDTRAAVKDIITNIRVKHPDMSGVIFFKSAMDAARVKVALERLPSIIKASDYRPPRQPSARRTDAIFELKVFKVTGRNKLYEMPNQKVDLNSKNSIYFIWTMGTTPLLEKAKDMYSMGTAFSLSSLAYHRGAYDAIIPGLAKQDIVFIPCALENWVKKNPNLVDMGKALIEWAKPFKDKRGYARKANPTTFSEEALKLAQWLKQQGVAVKKCDEVIEKINNIRKDMKVWADRKDAIEQATTHGLIDYADKLPLEWLDVPMNWVYTHYPLLKHLKSDVWTLNGKDVKLYTDAVDKSKGN